MNIKNLKIELKNNNVPKDSYTLLSSPQDDSLVLERNEGGWYVFYCERGLRTGEKFFSVEGDACKYFLSMIIPWFK